MGIISLKLCSLGLERDALRAEEKRRERGGENVYLDPYSHIDQSLVEVQLARDNNDPDLGTRHVSVLLSSRVIDPVGLLSAAWIHSRASSPRHTAVTRHKEGSISTAPRCLLPHLHAPSKSLHQPPGRAREKRHKNTDTTGGEEETERDKGRRKNGREKGGEKVRLIVLHQGHGCNTKVSPQIKTLWQQLSLTSTPLPLQQSIHNNLATTTHRGKDNFPLWQ